MKQINKTWLLLFLLHAANLFPQSLTFYVDPVSGNDISSGAIDQPFKTISKGLSALSASGTLFLMGGTYQLSSNVKPSKSGSASGYYILAAYPGELPVLDFSSEPFGSRGIYLSASYWHIKGLEIKNAGDNGVYISGSYNIIENCSIHDNQDSGLQIAGGGHDNRIINCDSYFNVDPGQGNADGFAPKLDTGSNNYFYGCRSWQNSDDGWDGYLRTSNDVTTVIENCWTFKNGYLKNGAVSKGNGNGFKMGGSDNKDLMHNVILKNCLAFDNLVKGFDQNNNRGSMTLLNCTGFRNGTYNFSVSSLLGAGKTLTIKNCISLASGGVSLLTNAVQQNNTWLSPFTVSNSDFVSVDPADAYGPRKPDGSLPDIAFMHLIANSPLVDAGVIVGIPFAGNGPDLGAFEYGMAMPTKILQSEAIPSSFNLLQNFPNPFNPETIINYQIGSTGNVSIKVYDLLGRDVATLVDEQKNPGKYYLKFNAGELSSGVYFYTISARDFYQTKKMILMK